MEKELGQVTLSYNKNSKSLYSKFESTFVSVNKDTDIDFGELDVKSKEEVIGNTVQNVIASWFKKAADAELADMFEYTIEHQLLKCLKYKTGELKEAKYRIVLKAHQQNELAS